MPADSMVTVDLRDSTPLSRHQMLFSSFERLQQGQSFQLLTDHDPQSLREQLQMRWGDGFNWSPLETEPAMWRVQVGKRAAQASNCCSGGACCG